MPRKPDKEVSAKKEKKFLKGTKPGKQKPAVALTHLGARPGPKHTVLS